MLLRASFICLEAVFRQTCNGAAKVMNRYHVPMTLGGEYSLIPQSYDMERTIAMPLPITSERVSEACLVQALVVAVSAKLTAAIQQRPDLATSIRHNNVLCS